MDLAMVSYNAVQSANASHQCGHRPRDRAGEEGRQKRTVGRRAGVEWWRGVTERAATDQE